MLRGQALKTRASELGIVGRGRMSAADLRKAVASATATAGRDERERRRARRARKTRVRRARRARIARRGY